MLRLCLENKFQFTSGLLSQTVVEIENDTTVNTSKGQMQSTKAVNFTFHVKFFVLKNAQFLTL